MAPKRNGDSKSRKVATGAISEIVGAEEWRQSKIGYLTGFSVGKRIVGDIGKVTGNSVGHVGGLIRGLRGDNSIPALGEGGTPDERFIASMELHNVDGNDLARMQRNSYRAAILYIALSIISFVIGLISWGMYPPQSAFSGIVRLGVLPLVVALAFKHSYTNWIIRNQKLSSPAEFIMGFEWWPKVGR